MLKKIIYFVVLAMLVSTAFVVKVPAALPTRKGLTNMWAEDLHQTIICCEANQNETECTSLIVNCSMFY